MLMYWLMYFVPASMVFFAGQSRKSDLVQFLFIGFIFIIFIGFRFDVGGDWGNYMRNYNALAGISLAEALEGKDPAHQFLNWFMYRWDFGVYGTNVVYGIIFMLGLIKFSRQESNPWVSMTVAVPYMIMVVAMGYSRQGMALGLFMWAITYLRKENLKMYTILILIAALFHKSAIILIPLGMFLYGKGLFLRILMIAPLTYGAWNILFAAEQSNLITQYIDRDLLESNGAKIRVAMNLLPSLFLLMYRKEWKRTFNDYTLWLWIALGSLLAMALVSVASTAVDRIALYFIPIQLVVYSRLPYLARKRVSPMMMRIMIVFGYAVVLFVWLNYANHARYWLPYQNILFMNIF